MIIFSTNNFVKLATHLQEHPRVKPTNDDNPPSYYIFDDEGDSEEDIKKKWKSKKKRNTGLVYQLGIPVPI
ncbi:MAG: hypothetical protein J7L15_03340 [Clostridiales bacterium]|nr:hypothetical protein [Clostridiales bacterium]